VMGTRARLHLALQEYDLAAAVARQALRLTADQLHAARLLLVLVEAEIALGDLAAAEEARVDLERMAERTEVSGVTVLSCLAAGKLAIARGDKEAGARCFENGLASVGDSCPPFRAALHLELARCHVDHAADAVVNAEAALRIYQALGAPEAGAAADILRAHGKDVPAAPPTASALDILSPREREVLDLVAEGLSNPDIAKRLFITPKTAEHHVGSILSKLGLRSRAEAAAFAVSRRINSDRQAPTSR
jgi:ATP/maltotriose-dependent transcriptional regulator MalT